MGILKKEEFLLWKIQKVSTMIKRRLKMKYKVRYSLKKIREMKKKDPLKFKQLERESRLVFGGNEDV